MAQLVEGNASALAEVKDQSAEMLSLLKQLASAPPAASGAGAATPVDRWAIAATSVKFEKEEDEDGDTVKVKLGSGSFGIVYVYMTLCAEDRAHTYHNVGMIPAAPPTGCLGSTGAPPSWHQRGLVETAGLLATS